MKKKVWLWNHYATGMSVNQGGRHYWFAQELKKEGYDPVIFCANTFHSEREPIVLDGNKYKEEVVGDIPFVYVETRPYTGNGIDRILNMAMFYRNLFPVAKDLAKKYGKPNVIIASSVHPLTMVAGIQVARDLGYLYLRSSRFILESIFAWQGKGEKHPRQVVVLGEHWIYKNADAIIFTKEGDIDYPREKRWTLLGYGDIDLKKCHYINNGVNLKSYYQSITENTLVDPRSISGQV